MDVQYMYFPRTMKSVGRATPYILYSETPPDSSPSSFLSRLFARCCARVTRIRVGRSVSTSRSRSPTRGNLDWNETAKWTRRILALD